MSKISQPGFLVSGSQLLRHLLTVAEVHLGGEPALHPGTVIKGHLAALDRSISVLISRRVASWAAPKDRNERLRTVLSSVLSRPRLAVGLAYPP